jgi:maltose O-acetyltransferase
LDAFPHVGGVTVSDYFFRVLNAALGSEILPATLRTKAMRAVGFDVSKTTTIWAGANLRSKRVKIGSNVFINVGFYHDGYDLLTIGDNVRIGPFVRAITATHEIGPSHQRGTVDVLGKPILIENGAWIGAGSVILPGVKIAHGCVVATQAVVHESTAPDGLYAGNPARRVRELEI